MGTLQVNSFDEFFEVDESEPEKDDIVIIILLSSIIVSAVGLITTITLLLGVSRRSSLLFLPWLVWHMLEILGCIASGTLLSAISLAKLSIC